MAKPERPGLLFPALILVLVGAVVTDVARRVLARPPACSSTKAMGATS